MLQRIQFALPYAWTEILETHSRNQGFLIDPSRIIPGRCHSLTLVVLNREFLNIENVTLVDISSATELTAIYEDFVRVDLDSALATVV